MNARNCYLIVASTFALLIYSCSNKQSTNSKTFQFDLKPSLKESNIKGDFIEHLDSVSLIYSNFKYGVSMDFPDNWTINKGVAEHTIIKGVQKDSAISFSINVIERGEDMLNDLNIWDIWDNKSLGLEQTYLKQFSKVYNSETYNYQTKKIYVSNKEAIQIKFNFLFKQLDTEYEMQSLMYSIYISPFTFTVGLHIPREFYDLNPVKYDQLITNLVFMKPKQFE